MSAEQSATAGHGHHEDGAVHAHISSFPFLSAIFMALITLTVITVAASYVDFGSANTVIAVFIATVKASLVAVFFMHLRHDKPFHAFAFVIAFVFLGVFLMLTFDDVSTRGKVDDAAGVQVLPRTGGEAPGGLPNEFAAGPEGHGAATHSVANNPAAPGTGTAAAH